MINANITTLIKAPIYGDNLHCSSLLCYLLLLTYEGYIILNTLWKVIRKTAFKESVEQNKKRFSRRNWVVHRNMLTR